MTQTRKKKRQTKTEFVLVRMEPELKKKLIAEARRRVVDPSALARTLITEGLELEAHNHEMRRSWKSKRSRKKRSTRPSWKMR